MKKEKCRVRLVTDPVQIIAILTRSGGKWKEYLPHYERNADGTLWIERLG